MRALIRSAAIPLLFALAACGGGGGSASTPPIHPTPTPTPSGAVGQAVITVNWPAAGAASVAHRAKPAYISTGSAGINIWVASGSGAAAFSVGIQNPCGSGTGNVQPSSHTVARTASCTSSSVTIGVPTGSATFYAYSYDGWDSVNNKGNGHLLAATTSGTTITVAAPPSTNTVTLTMNGIVSSYSTSPTFSGLPLAASDTNTYTNQTYTLTAYDASGAAISGTYANPVTVKAYDTLGAFSWSAGAFPATLTASGQTVTLSKNSTNDCAANLLLSASQYSDANVTGGAATGLSSIPFQMQADVNPGGNSASNNWFTRVRVCWAPINSSSTYYIYRGTSSGGEASTPYQTLYGMGALGYQDYSVLKGTTYFYVVCTTPTYSGTPGPTNPNCSPEILNGKAASDVKTLLGTKPVYWFDANDSVMGSTWMDKSGNANNMALHSFTAVSNAYGIPTRNALQSAATSYGEVTTSTGAPSNLLTTSTSNPLTIFVVASQDAANGNSYQRLLSLGDMNDQKGFVGTYGPTGSTYPGSVAIFWGNTLTSGNANCGNSWCDTHVNNPVISWRYALPQNTNYPAVVDVMNDGSCPAGPTPPYVSICTTNTNMSNNPAGGPIMNFNGTGMTQDHNGNMTPTAGMYIGATWVSGALVQTQPWIGTIDEIIVYNTALTTGPGGQVEKVEGYLACKWGAQFALPATHDYAASCP